MTTASQVTNVDLTTQPNREPVESDRVALPVDPEDALRALLNTRPPERS